MVFQIPQPTYMAYIVFLLSKDEKNATVTAALGALAAVTLAILLILGLELIDTAEPALRLPLMAIGDLCRACLPRARLHSVPSPTWPVCHRVAADAGR